MGQNANYRQIGGPNGHLANLRPFTGNTMRASVPAGYDTDGKNIAHCGRLYTNPEEAARLHGKTLVYIVWSYSTPIAVVTDTGERIIPDIGYSVTTTRQQNLCRAWMGNAIPEDLSAEEVSELQAIGAAINDAIDGYAPKTGTGI